MGISHWSRWRRAGFGVLVVVVAASVSVTDEVSASRRMLAQDLDQAGELHDFLKADSASRRPLADLYLEQDLANLNGDELSSEEDLGEGRRMFDFDPNKKESMDMYAQQILGYDKLIHDLEEKSLATTDWRAKGKLKWQIDSIKKLLRHACANYVTTTKPTLWSALNQTFLTSEHTVLNQCEKLALDARPPMNATNATNATNHTALTLKAMAAVKAADAKNDTYAKGVAIKALAGLGVKAARDAAKERKAAARAAAAARLAAPEEASTLIMAAREMVQDDLAMLDESF